jgi:hypothetical protein
LPVRKDEVGPRINFSGLTYGPTEEQGVILLFGMICEQLGFAVESVKRSFPDAVAIDYRQNPSLGSRKKIEFEFESSSFAVHKHDPKDCHIIVCWEHDWKNCPEELEVIELKTEIRKLKGEERYAERAISKRPVRLRPKNRTGKRLSGWEVHKRILTSSDAVEKRIKEAKARGVSQKYLRFLERLKRYWEIREHPK